MESRLEVSVDEGGVRAGDVRTLHEETVRNGQRYRLGSMFLVPIDGPEEVIAPEIRSRPTSRQDLLRQIPKLGEEPRVVGIENTDFQPARSEKSYLYLRIWSNSAARDNDWSEDVLLVDGEVFR